MVTLGVDSKLLLEDERNGGLSEEFLRYHDVVLADCDSVVVSQAGGWGVSLGAGKVNTPSSSTTSTRLAQIVTQTLPQPIGI